jgi:hypothetical protein
VAAQAECQWISPSALAAHAVQGAASLLGINEAPRGSVAS